MNEHSVVRMTRVQGGFTLIELLIVMAIIGVLAAIGVPQYQGYQDRAAISACSQELTAARTALVFSAEANNETLEEAIDGYSWSACQSGSVAMAEDTGSDSDANGLVGWHERFDDQAADMRSEAVFGSEVDLGDLLG